MRGGNLNFDSLDLRDRLGDSSLVQWVYSEHPEWDEPSRRLNTSADRKNTISWRGNTKVKEVNVVECWTDGRVKAIDILKASQIFVNAELDIDKIVKDEAGVDMLRPVCRATHVGVQSGDRATYDLAGDVNAIDDEYQELDSYPTVNDN